MPSGLRQCFIKWESNCWQLIRCFLDLFVAIIAFIQLVFHCRQGFTFTRIKHWFYILIILSVASNFIHQLFFEYPILFSLSTLFYDIYFVMILYYAGLKLIQGTQDNNYVKVSMHVMLGIGLVLQLLLFISSFYQSNKHKCFGIWYIIVRTLGFILGIVLCFIVKFHQNRAEQKLQTIKQIRQFNNPLPRLWTWVGINIASQTINLIVTYVFTFDHQLQCRYDKNNVTIQIIINLLMVILTYYIPELSTIWIFWKPCKCRQQSKRTQSVGYYQSDQGLLSMGMQLALFEDTKPEQQNSSRYS